MRKSKLAAKKRSESARRAAKKRSAVEKADLAIKLLQARKGKVLDREAKKILLIYMLKKYQVLLKENPDLALDQIHLNSIFLDTADSHGIGKETATKLFEAWLEHFDNPPGQNRLFLSHLGHQSHGGGKEGSQSSSRPEQRRDEGRSAQLPARTPP